MIFYRLGIIEPLDGLSFLSKIWGIVYINLKNILEVINILAIIRYVYIVFDVQVHVEFIVILILSIK